MLGKCLCFGRVFFLNELCRNSSPHFVCANLSSFKKDCACCYYGIFTYITAVKDHSIHAYKSTLADGSGMNYSSMTNRYVIFKSYRETVCLVDACVILHVDTVTDAYCVNIRTQYCTVPDATVITHDDVAC